MAAKKPESGDKCPHCGAVCYGVQTRHRGYQVVADHTLACTREMGERAIAAIVNDPRAMRALKLLRP